MRTPTLTLADLFAPEPEVRLPDAAGVLEVAGVCLDSRLLERGDLFLAVSGERTHGIRHAAGALARGAVAVAIDPEELAVAGAEDAQVAREHHALQATGATLVSVPALARRAPHIAARFHGHPDRALSIVAVTGTDGKTSVCRFVAMALEALGVPCGYIGTIGWGRGDALEPTALTTPDAVTLMRLLAALRDAGARAVALEASSHGLALGRLDTLALDVAVLTNLGRDHLDFHGDVRRYAQAKARLFDVPTLSALVLNGDDPFGRELAANAARREAPVTRFSFGMDVATGEAGDTGGRDASAVEDRPGAHDIVARDIAPSARGLAFTLVDGAERFPVASSLIGRFNVMNLLACHGVLRALGHAPQAAAVALGELPAVAGRMERFTAEARPTVLVDYAHTPQALAAALEAARAHCDAALWVVFGCGGDRDRGKRGPMGRAAEAADHVVVTDDNPRGEASVDIIAAVLAGMQEPSRAAVVPDRRTAIAHAVNSATPDDIVLIAGKGHEDYQIVGDVRLALSDRDCVGELLAEAC